MGVGRQGRFRGKVRVAIEEPGAALIELGEDTPGVASATVAGVRWI